jgi:uncharacterized protein YukE
MGGIGNDLVAAYQWTQQPLIDIDLGISIPHPLKRAHDDLTAGLDSIVVDVLRGTGLFDLLERVTGKNDQLTAAATVWLAQAKETKDITDQLRSGAKTLEGAWKGQASAVFGTYMGNIVGGLDSMAQDMATAAKVLADAASECQMAEDMVIEIIREAIEWMLATLAATAVADLLTFGLASIAGGLAEAGEMAGFIARAEQVSEKLANVLRKLETMLQDINKARKTKGVWQAYRAFSTAKRSGSMLWNAKNIAKLDNTALAGVVLHTATGVVKANIAEPVVNGLTGAGVDPAGAAKDGLTSDTGLATVARDINALTGTGGNYDDPYSFVNAEALNTIKKTG